VIEAVTITTNVMRHRIGLSAGDSKPSSPASSVEQHDVALRALADRERLGADIAVETSKYSAVSAPEQFHIGRDIVDDKDTRVIRSPQAVPRKCAPFR